MENTCKEQILQRKYQTLHVMHQREVTDHFMQSL